MNCRIIIRRKGGAISISGKFEELKTFLPLKTTSAELPGHFVFRYDTSRMIEVAVTPDTSAGAKIGIDMAKQYLSELSRRKPGETIRIKRRELAKIIRELQHAGESI